MNMTYFNRTVLIWPGPSKDDEATESCEVEEPFSSGKTRD